MSAFSLLRRHTAVLHVGLHKTGSTSIQESLKKAQNDGVLTGAVYLRSAPSNHSYVVAPAFGSEGNTPYYTRLKFGGRLPLGSMTAEAARQVIADGVHEARTRHLPLIISAEDFCCLTPAEVLDVRDFLDELGVATTRVIAYIRPVESWANSYAAQLVKQGLRTIPEVLENPPYPMFREYLQKYVEVFGPKRMTVRPLDRATLAGGSVLQDLLHRSARPNRNADVAELRRNVSPNLDQLRLVSLFTEVARANGLRVDLKKMQSKLHRFREDSAYPDFALPRETLDDIQQKASGDASWLVSTFSLDRGFLEKPSADVAKDVLLDPIRDVDLVQYIAAQA
jgi:hypothetical protein